MDEAIDESRMVKRVFERELTGVKRVDSPRKRWIDSMKGGKEYRSVTGARSCMAGLHGRVLRGGGLGRFGRGRIQTLMKCYGMRPTPVMACIEH